MSPILRSLALASVAVAVVAACSGGATATTVPTRLVPAASTPTTAPAGTSESQPPEPTTDPWNAYASEFRGQDGTRHELSCYPNGDLSSSVWGTDVYTDDSRICTAAVHAGVITREAGGRVTYEIRPGQDSYTGSQRNGVTSSNYGSWDGSYVFIKP